MAYGPDTDKLLTKIANIKHDTLNVSELHITSLPELPVGLKELDCRETEITDLPILPLDLRILKCSDTKLRALSGLPVGLKELGCYSNTHLTTLELPVGLDQLYCFMCPSLMIKRLDNESITEYRHRWTEWKEEGEASKKRCQERNASIKEDFIAEFWKPKRVEKMLEIGGWDLVDMYW